MWTQREAIDLCIAVEAAAPKAGCHVALTGGCLYKTTSEPRKDCDLLFYRIRQKPKIDKGRLFSLLEELGFKKITGQGWLYKARYNDKPLDLFFPENEDGDYNP